MKKSAIKDNSDFYCGQAIARDIVNIIDQQEISNDKIDDFIENNNQSSELLKNLTNPEYVTNILADYNRVEKSDGEVALIKKTKKRESQRRIKRITYSILSVASVLTAVSLILFSANDPISSVKSDVIVTTPTLKLGNGVSINLNDEHEIIANSNLVEKKGSTKIFLKNNHSSSNISYNTITVPSKFTYSVVLEDSTEVFLNANSEFKYPSHFGDSIREVFLKGEGYFKVAKESRRFVVNTEMISVKVYGTEFNVNTNSRNTVETVLVSGSVGVTIKNGSSVEVKMSPNQLFKVNSITLSSELMSVDPHTYLGWITNRFISDDEPLGLLLDKIALWYNVEFEYHNEEILNTPVVLYLMRTSNVDSVLEVISKLSKVKFIKTSSNKYVVK